MGRRAPVLVVTVLLSCAVLAAPGARASDDEPSLVEFKLPDQAAIDSLNATGADLAEYVRYNPDGTVVVDAWVTPAQKAVYEAMGYPAIGTIDSPATVAARRDERDATLAEERAADRNLEAGHTVANARGRLSAAAADTVRMQRADYFQNYAGRFISIEATTSTGSNVGAQNPVMAAAWDSGPGTEIGSGGSGNLSPFIDASAYLYHRNLFRVGNNGDGKPMPSRVRVASANGGVDTLPVKEWVTTNGHSSPPGFVKDFLTHYVDPQEASATITSLATEFPNIAQVIDLPNKTPGYQRKSQAIVGTATPYTGATGSLPAAQAAQAVQVTSKAWGQDGGNRLSIQLVNPAGNDKALTVAAAGDAITVSLATDATGAITSTAAQVVAALNTSSDASALVTAERYHANAGAGVVAPGASPAPLKDFLNAPASVPRGPATVKAIRIGAHRDGSKTGIFLYCQEHAREWVTPLVCLETAERLVRNYATDSETRQMVDNLDIFILPTMNADGANYSLYDFMSQRKNMVNYCGPASNAPTDRNAWGVDLNRNFDIGSLFDGYDGASSECTSGVYAGPSELSEPEVRNEVDLTMRNRNIKFSNNIHSYGGYFMWSPAAYKTTGRETLPYAPYGAEQFFQQTADTTIDRIKSSRGTAILPARTGPVADVLYSAAGNSSDEKWYREGILAYDFEVGADRFTSTTSGTGQSAVGFFPDYAAEGHAEGLEFADGNYGLLEAALSYERDHTPPSVKPIAIASPQGGLDVTWDQSEPADIYYTLDGSTPTTDSTHYKPPAARARPLPIHISTPSTLRWLAVDVKGQAASGAQTFTATDVGGTVPATLSLSLGSGSTSLGTFVPGVERDYTGTLAANVISTAGDAVLSVADPSATATGRLVNGSFSLARPLQVRATNPANTSTAFNPVGSSTSPLGLLSYPAPISNDPVTVGFKQSIGANEGLRTGGYRKTLVFTLSTGTP